MRILGVDYGDKRIGLAICDPLEIIAGALECVQSRGQAEDVKYIASLVKKNDVRQIVIGLPKNMDGSEGERALITRDFGQKLLETCQIDVVYKDERLSSVAANRVLDEADVHWSKRKNMVDVMSAQIILQSFLDAKKRLNS